MYGVLSSDALGVTYNIFIISFQQSMSVVKICNRLSKSSRKKENNGNGEVSDQDQVGELYLSFSYEVLSTTRSSGPLLL